MKALCCILCLVALLIAAASGTDKPAGVPPEVQKTLLAFLPADKFVSSFQREEPVRFYDQSNLYEYIDGQAEGFIGYNFQALASATYGEEGGSVVVDIYDMERPIQAFGLYSSFRAPSNDFVEIGGQGFKTGEGLMFWKGRYVVRIFADCPDDAAIARVSMAAARAVEAKVPQDSTGLDILSLLPAEGRAANTEKYTMRAVLGQGFLNNGVIAEYPVDKIRARLFVCDMGSAEAAAKAYAEYLKFATAHGKPVESQPGKAFRADVKYYGATEVFVSGKCIAGGVGLPSDSAKLIDSLKKTLSPPVKK